LVIAEYSREKRRKERHRQIGPASWFVKLCEGERLAEGASVAHGSQGKQAESYEPVSRLQVFPQRRHLSYFAYFNSASCAAAPARGMRGTEDACGRGGCVALFSGKAQGEAIRSMVCRPGASEEHPMDHAAATLAIRRRLRQRILPHGELWRRLGEYTGGGSCGGCGERITSAQASYAVDFAPGVTSQTIRFHRACFEIWQCECQTALPS
jgi:hypothetical protein